MKACTSFVLLNFTLLVNCFSTNYYEYDITTQGYKPVGALIADTFQTNSNGLSFNFSTENPFEIRFNQNSIADYNNPTYKAFQNLKFSNAPLSVQ